MKKAAIIFAALTVLLAPVTVCAADSVTIEYDDLKYVSGDVNCDEKINGSDIGSLRNVLLGIVEPERPSTAETTGDSELDIRDLVRLGNYVEGNADVTLGG